MTGRDDEVRLLHTMHRDAVALARSGDRLLCSQYAQLAGQIEALLIINGTEPVAALPETSEPSAAKGI
jgi:hypothetical protein